MTHATESSSETPLGRRRAWLQREERIPRPLRIAVGISLAGHVLILAIRLGSMDWQHRTISAESLRVIYDTRAAKQEFVALQRALGQLGDRRQEAPSAATPTPQIRIPDRRLTDLPVVRPGGGIPGSSGASRRLGPADGLEAAGGQILARALSGPPSPVVDLTNLVAAAQGDPVLLSYFSVIREQIQQTANRKTWMTGKASARGIVYLSFVLIPTGQVQSVAVLSDRSVRSEQLQGIALSIIQASGPFPPFPPSINAPFKTVIVPLEFLMGS